MLDLSPVVLVIGRITILLGVSMLVLAGVEWENADPNFEGMALSAFLTLTAGLGLTAVTLKRSASGLSRQQAFMLTTLVWVVLPGFGALPLMLGTPGMTLTDAYFEAMSAFTTTGSTVMTGLDTTPEGVLLWRALMQWYGGVGIVVVAIVFLPVLKIGGMQFFRSEGFELQADVVPRAVEAAISISWIYVGLTVLCMLAYSATGMDDFDALCHAMTTISTGGLANYDASFGAMPAASHYVGALFMTLAALPLIKLVMLAAGRTGPIMRDSQVQAFLGIIAVVVVLLALWMIVTNGRDWEPAFRAALFNGISVLTGTGYSSEDYSVWGGFAVTIFFAIALIGGCSGSTTCAAKVFRFQILYAALLQQIRRIHSPSGMYPLRYQNRTVSLDVVSSIMAYFFVYIVALSVWAILLSMLGYDTLTAVSGSVAALTNVGPGLGPEIGPAGSFAGLSDAAKWLLAAGMVLGRLEFISVLVLFMPMFWQR